jgi:hypothetical protein
MNFSAVETNITNSYTIFLSETVTFSLLCRTPSRYCVEYSNGTLHDVLTFELIVIASAIFAIFGYVRASILYKQEREVDRLSEDSPAEDNAVLLDHNEAATSA